MPTTVLVYFDDVAIECRVIRVIRVKGGNLECLVSVGGQLEYAIVPEVQ